MSLHTDVARFYGDGAKYKAVWDRMNIISKNAKAIAAAVEAGQDPFAVPLDDTQSAAKPKAKGIPQLLHCFSDFVLCTLHILFRFASAICFLWFLVHLLILLRDLGEIRWRLYQVGYR